MPKRSISKRSVAVSRQNAYLTDQKGLPSLPLVIFLALFEYLDRSLQQWCCLQLVCQRWYAEARDARWVGLLEPFCTKSVAFGRLMKLNGLRHLELDRFIGPAEVKQLAKLVTLKELHVVRKAGCNKRLKVDVRQLSCLTNLEGLSILQDVEGLSTMCANMSSLKIFNVSFLNDDVLRSLPRSITMVETFGHGLTDAGVQVLERFPELNSLVLTLCQAVTLSGVNFSNFTNLRTLRLSQASVKDCGMSSLSCLKLSELVLSDMSVTNESLIYLSGMKTLKKLELILSDVSDITPLTSLTALEVLSLSRSRICDEGLIQVSCLQSLQVLDVSGNVIRNLESVAKLKNLIHLTVQIGNWLSEENLNFFTTAQPKVQVSIKD